MPKTIGNQISTSQLSKWKHCASFVQHPLMREQHNHCAATLNDLVPTNWYDKNFVNKIITGDKSWYFAYNLEKKCQSMERVGKSSLRVKKLCFQKSPIRQCWFFLDSQSLVCKEFLKKKLINFSYSSTENFHLLMEHPEYIWEYERIREELC